MAESYYYDPETNKLVVGEAALAAESAGWEMGDYDPELPPVDDNHGNLYNLQDALADETVLPTASKPSERPRVAKWDTESIILVGQWLSKLLKGRDVNTIREGHIRILNALDMSPSIKTIERRVGSFSQFRANANDEMSIWKLRASQAQPLPAAETYYDRHTKKLVIGKAALAAENARWEMGDHDFEEPPSDEAKESLYSLTDLLTRDALPENISVDPLERALQSPWHEESITQLAHWTFKLLRSTGADRLSEEHFNRLSKLGISPTSQTIRRKIDGGISQLRLNAGDKKSRRPLGMGHDWPLSRWRDYAKKVEQSLQGGPRRPTRKDYINASKQFGGPSYRNIRSTLGINQLNALIDYLNPAEMDAADIADWGANVIAANPASHNPLDRYAIEALSNKDAGLSLSFILKHYASLTEFQTQARQHFETRAQEREEHLQRRLSRFNQVVTETGRAESLSNSLSDEEKLTFIARYDLAVKILGAEHEENAWKSALLTHGRFTYALREIKPDLTGGDIELQAELLGLMDDIWPIRTDLDRLRLTTKEVEAVRAKYAGAHERAKERAQTPPAVQSGNATSASSSIQEVRSGIEISKEHAQEAIKLLEQARESLAVASSQLQQIGAGSGEIEQVVITMYQITGKINEIQGQVEAATRGGDNISERL